MIVGCVSNAYRVAHLKNYIGTSQVLNQPLYLAELNRDSRSPSGNTVCNCQYLLFREKWISFMQEHDIVSGPIEKLDPGTKIEIRNIKYQNRIDEDDYFACGLVLHPENESEVSFQYTIHEITRLSETNEAPSFIMKNVLRSKKSETVTTVLSRLPWDDEETPEARVLDEINLYY